MNYSRQRIARAITAHAVLAALLVLLAGWSTAFAQPAAGDGVIEARAVMSTSGSAATLGGLPASLFTYVDGARQTPPAVGQTDAEGRVRFDGLHTSSAYSYTLFVKFQDTIYRSHAISFAPGSSIAQATVRVYESTRDDTGLRVDQRHVIVDLAAEGQALSILEVYLLTNTGDRTIAGSPATAAGSRPVSFRALLPPDAILERIEGREPDVDIFRSGSELLDTRPIPPGQATLVFAYRLPYARSNLALGLSSPYPISSTNLLVAPDISVRGTRLVSQGTVAAGDRQFQHFHARDLPARATLAVELSGLPAPLIPFDVLQWLPLAAASLGLIAVLILASRRAPDHATPRRKTPA